MAPKSLGVYYILRENPSTHMKLGGSLNDFLPLIWHDGTDPEISRRTDTGVGNIQLTMAENRSRQVQTGPWQSLPLRFVDSHSKSWSNWKLDALHDEWEIFLVGEEGNSGDENVPSFSVLGPYALISVILNEVPVVVDANKCSKQCMKTLVVYLDPLQSPVDWSKLRSNMMGMPGFKRRVCGGNPEGLSEFKNS
jgi:hypothetical protein